MIVMLKTRNDFPFHHDEEFIVRDGDGNCVERWRHLSGPHRQETDKAHERHRFHVEGYE